VRKNAQGERVEKNRVPNAGSRTRKPKKSKKSPQGKSDPTIKYNEAELQRARVHREKNSNKRVLLKEGVRGGAGKKIKVKRCAGE